MEPLTEFARVTCSSGDWYGHVIDRTVRTVLTMSEHGTRQVMPVIKLRNNLKLPEPLKQRKTLVICFLKQKLQHRQMLLI